MRVPIRGVTNQDGSYLVELLWKKAKKPIEIALAHSLSCCQLLPRVSRRNHSGIFLIQQTILVVVLFPLAPIIFESIAVLQLGNTTSWNLYLGYVDGCV